MMMTTALVGAKAQESTMPMMLLTPAKSIATTANETSPMRALSTNQKYMGPYEGDDLATNGVAFTSTGTYRVAAMLPAGYVKKFNGGKIVAIRIGLCEALSNVRGFVTAVSNGTIGGEVLSKKTLSMGKGWNELKFTSPYTITADGTNTFLIGYEYSQTSGKKPISLAGESYDGGFYSWSTSYGWTNQGVNDYGNVSVQCIVEKDGIQQIVDVSIDEISFPLFVKSGDAATLKIKTKNFCTSASNCNYTISIDGKQVGDWSEIAVGNDPVTLTKTITIDSDYQAGQKHTVAVKLTQVGGSAPTGDTSDDTASTTFMPYTQTTARQMNLVEQQTATWCQYCPYGAAALEQLCSQRSDVAWVALHSSDAFSVSESSYIMSFLSNGGIPAGSFNRYLLDGASDISIGLGYSNAEYAANLFSSFIDESMAGIPTFAQLDIETAYNASTRQLDITVKGKGVEKASTLMGDDLLTIYLTEEGITSAQKKDSEVLSDYLHHGLLRKVVTESTGDAITWRGNNFETTYSLTLDEAWDATQMHVVVFTHRPFYDAAHNTLKTDKTDAWVGNANQVAVGSSTTSIGSAVKSDVEKSPNAYYSIDGQRLSTPRKGINIIRFSDGTTKKVLVK